MCVFMVLWLRLPYIQLLFVDIYTKHFRWIKIYANTRNDYTYNFITKCKPSGMPKYLYRDGPYLPHNVCFTYLSVLACVPYDTRFVVLNAVFRLLLVLCLTLRTANISYSSVTFLYFCNVLLPAWKSNFTKLMKINFCKTCSY